MSTEFEIKLKELQIENSLLKKEIEKLKLENQFLRSNNPIEVPNFEPRDPPEIFKEEIKFRKVQTQNLTQNQDELNTTTTNTIKESKIESKPPADNTTINTTTNKIEDYFKFDKDFNKTTSENERLKDLRIKKERYYDLGKIPYQSGAYILKFPNGKSYIGEAKNLRITIKKCLAELFPKPQTVMSRQRNCRPPFKMKWMEQARKENSVRSYQDLEIRAIVCQNPAYLKKKLLEEIEGEHYNYLQ